MGHFNVYQDGIIYRAGIKDRKLQLPTSMVGSWSVTFVDDQGNESLPTILGETPSPNPAKHLGNINSTAQPISVLNGVNYPEPAITGLSSFETGQSMFSWDSAVDTGVVHTYKYELKFTDSLGDPVLIMIIPVGYINKAIVLRGLMGGETYTANIVALKNYGLVSSPSNTTFIAKNEPILFELSEDIIKCNGLPMPTTISPNGFYTDYTPPSIIKNIICFGASGGSSGASYDYWGGGGGSGGGTFVTKADGPTIISAAGGDGGVPPDLYLSGVSGSLGRVASVSDCNLNSTIRIFIGRTGEDGTDGNDLESGSGGVSYEQGSGGDIIFWAGGNGIVALDLE